jgi:hypothetical protein
VPVSKGKPLWQSGDLAIQSDIVFALRDGEWHTLPYILGRIKGRSPFAVERVIATMVQYGLLLADPPAQLQRYRILV